MSFDPEIYTASAEKGEVADIAIHAALVVNLLVRMVQKIAEGTELDLAEELDELRKLERLLEGRFDKLTGYEPDES